jgi:pre-mRNA-splicing helicase BRR2
VTQNVSNKQDAVDFLTWTFFYRRIAQNPNYYNLQGVTHRHISDHLSELIESTLSDLSKSRCILIDENEMDVSALNLGMIAAYYYIQYTTIELFNESLSKTTKMRGLIEIISHATEFESLAIRQKEDDILAKLAAHLPVKISKPDYHSTATKVNILLQSYFSRRVLSPDLAEDQNLVLRTAPRLLQALVDVISSNGWLNPAIAAMELSQMIVQAMWDSDSPLKQLPHLTHEVIERIKKEEPNCESIMDFLDLDDKRRVQLLKMDKTQIIDVARAANRYPNVEVQHEIQDPQNIVAGGKVKVAVSLQRDLDEDEKLGPVHAPFYPGEKVEGWWLIIGDSEANALYAIKKITLTRASLKTVLDFDVPPTITGGGGLRASLYLMSDSYIGCDQEFELSLLVRQSGGASGGEDAMDTDS